MPFYSPNFCKLLYFWRELIHCEELTRKSCQPVNIDFNETLHLYGDKQINLEIFCLLQTISDGIYYAIDII